MLTKIDDDTRRLADELREAKAGYGGGASAPGSPRAGGGGGYEDGGGAVLDYD